MAIQKPKTFQRPGRSFGTQEEYIASLDELLKRNKGQGLAFGADVAPYQILPQSRPVSNPFALEGTEPTANVSTFQPTPQAIEQLPTLPQEQTQTQTQRSSSKGTKSGKASIDFIQEVVERGTPKPTGQVSQDGGMIYTDGSRRFEDGLTIKADGTREIEPEQVGSVGDYIIYRDGSVKQMATANSYTDLASAFYPSYQGQVYKTQGFGNYNPSMGYAGGMHRGVDLAPAGGVLSWDTPLVFPTGGTIVDAYNGDGYNGGYGKTVTIRMDNGETFKFSHLSDVKVAPGQRFESAFDLGTPGNTGNSTAAHTDIEYIRPDGTLDSVENSDLMQNPQKYSVTNKVDVDPSTIKDPGVRKAVYKNTLKVAGSDVESLKRQEVIADPAFQEANREVNIEKGRAETEKQNRLGYNEARADNPVGFGIANMLQKFQGQVGQAIEQNVQGRPDLGISEGMQQRSPENPAGHEIRKTGNTNWLQESVAGLLQSAGNVVDKFGTKFGLPETGFSENIAGNTTGESRGISSTEAYNYTPEMREKLASYGTTAEEQRANQAAEAKRLMAEKQSTTPQSVTGVQGASDVRIGEQNVQPSAPVSEKQNVVFAGIQNALSQAQKKMSPSSNLPASQFAKTVGNVGTDVATGIASATLNPMSAIPQMAAKAMDTFKSAPKSSSVSRVSSEPRQTSMPKQTAMPKQTVAPKSSSSKSSSSKSSSPSKSSSSKSSTSKPTTFKAVVKSVATKAVSKATPQQKKVVKNVAKAVKTASTIAKALFRRK